ncbi:PREDICTED: uncharacterized protein LOC106812705 [Priapulus caudatus]|uniref:Uncharacterized protein LOC106812705 n=1 Tax=Priapulus caudatus TaxID=37621 RepID=A0ABM1EIW3_PRICU|nr:PREDICTED: uncharacterized protein LOC106812705 [Priapulus caudatus]
MFFLWDVVNCLSTVSEAFQQRDVTIADVYQELEAAKCILEKYKARDGPKLKMVIGLDEYNDKGQVLKGQSTSFTSYRKRLIDGLLKSLGSQFEVDENLMKAATIVKLELWPQLLSEDQDFGDDKVAVLLGKLAPALDAAGMDSNQIEPEFTRLKCLLYQSYPDIKSLSWETINRGMVAKCPNILALIDLVLTFPAGSVEAERGFSQMGIVKNDWRSCLLDSNLSDLLMVLLETPEVGEFDPSEAIHLWNSAGSRARRPNYMEDAGDVEEEEEEDFVPDEELQQLEDKANDDLAFSMPDD